MPLEIVFLEPQNWRPLKPITKSLLPPSRLNTFDKLHATRCGVSLPAPTPIGRCFSYCYCVQVGVSKQRSLVCSSILS